MRSDRCQAMTDEGTRCARKVGARNFQLGKTYCSWHERSGALPFIESRKPERATATARDLEYARLVAARGEAPWLRNPEALKPPAKAKRLPSGRCPVCKKLFKATEPGYYWTGRGWVHQKKCWEKRELVNRRKKRKANAKKIQKAKDIEYTRYIGEPKLLKPKEYKTEQGKKYQAYINSKAWAKKRRLYWASVSTRVCQVPGCGEQKDLHVHHHTYVRLEDELLSDLIGLCLKHHDEVHAYHKAHRGMSLTQATEAVCKVKLEVA